MFKRLADRVSSALASVAGPVESIRLTDHDRLTNMGFSSSDAHHALQITGGNMEQAAEWLLTNASSTSHSVAVTAITARTEEDEYEKAIAASLEDVAVTVTASNIPIRPGHVQPNGQSAASKRAGQAALDRMDKVLHLQSTTKKTPSTSTQVQGPIQSHPNVKVPKPLNQHDKQDVILRCAQRIAPYPLAVDTLLKSLTQLQKNTTNLKYRTIDTATAAFKRSLDVPGARDFLRAIGFHASQANKEILELSFVDPATLYIAISVLQQVQNDSEEYTDNKAALLFDKEVDQILVQADQDMQEALARSQFMTKLPSEPVTGGGQIIVQLGSKNKIQRKFDGDDCLEDILNWLGAHGSVIPVKLEQKHWYLVNRNHAESVAYNISELKNRTLQYLGCWPSARLAVVPRLPASTGITPTSSRGLGAAPIDILRLK